MIKRNYRKGECYRVLMDYEKGSITDLNGHYEKTATIERKLTVVATYPHIVQLQYKANSGDMINVCYNYAELAQRIVKRTKGKVLNE